MVARIPSRHFDIQMCWLLWLNARKIMRTYEECADASFGFSGSMIMEGHMVQTYLLGYK